MKRYLRIELLLLIAQLMAIGVLLLVSLLWENQVDRILGTPNRLPAVSLLIYTHHTLFFTAPAIFLVLLYGFCFHRYDRSVAGRRFVIVSISLLIILTCAITLARQFAEEAFRWEYVKRTLKEGTKA